MDQEQENRSTFPNKRPSKQRSSGRRCRPKNLEQERKPPRAVSRSTYRENWRQARSCFPLANGILPKPLRENQFWSKSVRSEAKSLPGASAKLRPAFSQVLEGGGKKNPQEVFDYFAELDIRSPRVKIPGKANSREYLLWINSRTIDRRTDAPE